MRETSITRRRVVQGAGAVGMVSVLGTTGAVAQNETDGTGDQQQAALRVAHASPDAPNVDVRLTRRTVGDGGTVGNQTGDGVGGNQTGDGQQGNQTGADDEQATTPIEGLGFREVSSYNQVEPGTYQVEVVSAADEGFLGGLLEDLFGGDDEEEDETVLFEGEVDLQPGSTHTAVAYGEVRRGPVPATDDEPATGPGGDDAGAGADAGNQTGGVGDDTADGIGNETDAGVGDDAGAGARNETDVGDETATGAENETAVGQVGNETDGVGADGVDEGAAGGRQVVEDLSFGEHESFEIEAGDYTLFIRESPAVGQADGTPDAAADGGQVETETGAGTAGNETEIGQDDEDGIGQDDETGVGGAGNETGLGEEADEPGVGQAGNETGDGEPGAETDGVGADGDVGAEESAERGFQVEVVEDDLTDPGEDMSRLRVFHAVPDVDAVSISAESAEQAGGDNQTGDGVGGNQTGDGIGGNQTGDGVGGEEPGAGDDETGVGGDGTGVGDNETGIDQTGNETGAGATQDGTAGGGRVREVEISPAGHSVYSGFAVGYFDPEIAAGLDGNVTADNATGDGVTGNRTDGGVGGDQTDGGIGDNQTDDGTAGDGADGGVGGNQTGGNQTEPEDVAQDVEGEEFELVTVKDAEDGERADGGTNGLFGLR